MGNACTNIKIEEDFELLNIEKNKHIPQVGHIKFLSYNIFIRPPMITNNGDDFKDERLEEFVKSIRSYDIICLQEMFGSYSARRSKLVEKAKELGFLFHKSSPKTETLSQHFIDGGLLILSRYPIIASVFCPYPEGLGADYYVNKGVLYVKIRIGDSYLHLYNTHAQATYDGTPQYFLKRIEQFVCFQRFIKETLTVYEYTNEDLVLLAGDFNVNGREKAKYNSNDPNLLSVIKAFPNLGRSQFFSEYDALINCLTNDHQEDEIEDILFVAKYGEHPITFGDYYVTDQNERKPKEKILTHKECFCADESLDYIFRYIPNPQFLEDAVPQELNAKPRLVVKEETAAVEKFFVTGHDFDQLSDHYGVKVILEYIKKDEIS